MVIHAVVPPVASTSALLVDPAPMKQRVVVFEPVAVDQGVQDGLKDINARQVVLELLASSFSVPPPSGGHNISMLHRTGLKRG